jgi:hypothetical protein
MGLKIGINEAVTLALVALGVYVIVRGPKQAAKDIAEGFGNVIGGATTGAVIGVGKALGVPETDDANCQLSMRQGDAWSASFYCPAGTYLEWLRRGMPQNGASGTW